MDNADFANDLMLERLEQTLAARKPALEGHSRAACEECDEPIPEGRRSALPGVRLCIECQVEADWRAR